MKRKQVLGTLALFATLLFTSIGSAQAQGYGYQGGGGPA